MTKDWNRWPSCLHSFILSIALLVARDGVAVTDDTGVHSNEAPGCSSSTISERKKFVVSDFG